MTTEKRMRVDMGRMGAIPAFIVGGLMAIVGGWFLTAVVNNTWLVPVTDPRFLEFQRGVVLGWVNPAELMQASDWRLVALFLLGLLVLVAGVAMPLTYYFNRRWQASRGSGVSFVMVLRQAVWLGTWIAFCTWLHMHRAFGLAIAALVLIFFVMLEGLLIVRQRSAETLRTSTSPSSQSANPPGAV